MKITVENAKKAGFKELAGFAKQLSIKSVGLKTEDLRANVIAAINADGKAAKHTVKESATEAATKAVKAAAAPKTETKKAAPAPKAETKKPVAVTVSKEHLKAIEKLATKKERILKLNELGYKASVICAVPSIDQHVTNVLAALRKAGLGTGKTIAPEVREQISKTVTAKVAKKVKAKARK